LEGLGGRNQSTYDRERRGYTKLRSWPGPREERGREELDVVLNRMDWAESSIDGLRCRSTTSHYVWYKNTSLNNAETWDVVVTR
jgi:hypothetical protein